jgi:hypothetical protein
MCISLSLPARTLSLEIGLKDDVIFRQMIVEHSKLRRNVWYNAYIFTHLVFWDNGNEN